MHNEINHADSQAVVDAGLNVASKSGVPIVQQAAQALQVISKMVGGVSQHRFIDRTSQVFDIFKAAGYSTPAGNPRDVTYTNFKIGKSDVPDKKKDGTYAPEFERLRQYIIARLNSGNPGLGAWFNVKWPAMIMANKGNTGNQIYVELEKLVKKYPPGSYKPGDEPMPDTSVTPPYSGGVPDLTQSKLAAGDPNNPNAMASMKMPSTNTILIMVAMVIIVYLFYKFSK